jgi:Protein kinase domain
VSGYPGLEPGSDPVGPVVPPYQPPTAPHPLTAPHAAEVAGPAGSGPPAQGGTPRGGFGQGGFGPGGWAQGGPARGGLGPGGPGRGNITQSNVGQSNVGQSALGPGGPGPDGLGPGGPGRGGSALPGYGGQPTHGPGGYPAPAPARPAAQPPAAAPPAAPSPGQGSYPFGPSPLGTVLDGRYLLEGRIATGGMGEVWRGLDQTLGRPVAVKLLRPEYAGDESFLVRFRGEARHAAGIAHPGVASVYDYGEVTTESERPTAYLVMELVEGEPLSALLHREKRLTPDQTLDILGQAADALQAAHALGVVHRDVKPGNLLIRRDGAIKVTDFGIARAVDAAPLTATGIMMGTAYYVSPEQASGRTVTPASDVYSLGVVAYECLAGRRPFDDRNPIVVVMAHQQDTPPPLPSDVPDQVRALIDMAMAKDPARRPPSAGAFARGAATIRRQLWNADAARSDATRRGVTATAFPPTTVAGGAGSAWGAARGGWPDAAAGSPRSVPPSTGRAGLARERDDRTAMAPNAAAGYPGGRQPELGPPTPPQPQSWRGSPRGLNAAVSKVVNLPMPVLVAVLLLTVLVVTLITRVLAGSSGGSASFAPLVAPLVALPGARRGRPAVNEDRTGWNGVDVNSADGTARGPRRPGGEASAGDWRD